MVTLTTPGPELQSQNRVDFNYEKTFGLGAQLTSDEFKLEFSGSSELEL